jgi:uncharacterized alpha-E superfamily protein
MRHCISAEMWTSLNLAYLKFQRVSLQDIWMSAPESFYSEVATEINTFSGVAEATMYRDDGWHFMQLGYLIERAQLSASLLLAQIAGSADEEEADWTSLLRVYHAVEAYNRRYGVEVHSDQVLDLLVTDPMLPNSLCRSLDVTAEQLAGLGPGPDAGSSAAARRLAGRLGALIHYEWPDREDHEESLLQVNAYCRELHNLVNATYFEYDL